MTTMLLVLYYHRATCHTKFAKQQTPLRAAMGKDCRPYGTHYSAVPMAARLVGRPLAGPDVEGKQGCL